MGSESEKTGASRLEDAGRKIGQKLGETQQRVEKELREMVNYVESDVIPDVRNQSTKALRSLSQKLIELAEYMEGKKPGQS
ncbi:MAG TPA: hypothetical protein VGQ71_06260 [Terriglobales bacterium]|jgi:hypothetical protein|nr:hypothetical protein [Terriglobales bacterium]